MSKSGLVQHCHVIKRDGRCVVFDPQKIRHAIEGAFREDRELSRDELLPGELSLEIDGVADAAIAIAVEVASSGRELTVEAVQDLCGEEIDAGWLPLCGQTLHRLSGRASATS